MIRFGVVDGKEKRENQVKPGKFKTFKDFHIDLGIDLATKAESSPGKHVASFVRPHRISEEKRRLSSEEISSRHNKNNNSTIKHNNSNMNNSISNYTSNNLINNINLFRNAAIRTALPTTIPISFFVS